tara:strand:+ start:457 stop:1026 length:570 start_codon:yes stop_codon:yes gene_type:complete
MTKTELQQALISVQTELKAPKNQYNSFGKYKYRSAEDILEAVKPLLSKYGVALTLTENTQGLEGYLVLTSTAIFSLGDEKIIVNAQAGINPQRKGMDIAQSFGASSSYAKKYALGNLFLLDDTKDADTNKDQVTSNPVASKSVMTVDVYNAMLEAINTGKSSTVESRLSSYTMTAKQSDTLNRMIKEVK